MSDKVIKLADKAAEHGINEGLRLSVEDQLEKALEQLRAGEYKADKVVICLSSEEDDTSSYYTANCSLLSALGLLERIKLMIYFRRTGGN